MAASGKQAWSGWLEMPRIEALRTPFALIAGRAEQKKLAHEIQALAIEEGMLMPRGQYYMPAAIRTRLSKPIQAPTPAFWGMTKTKK